MSDLSLKTDFRTASIADWHAVVEKGLRGASPETLKQKTEDGIVRGPLFSATDLPLELAALGRIDTPQLAGRDWHIAAPVRNPDLSEANARLLEDLKGGASAVRIEPGPDLSSRNRLKRLLEGVYTDLVPIQFSSGALTAESFEQILSLDQLKSTHIWAGLDPSHDSDVIYSGLNSERINWRLMGISTTGIHDDGGTNVQEIAILAASFAEAMRKQDPKTVCRNMVIDIAADQDTHLTIAKIRAARRIILRIADAFEADGTSIPLCAVTSLRMMQTEDAWTNLLRVMSAGFGAIIGGADMITTRPFTDGLGHATPFAHRIARNMQLMMMEESHLGQVSDAAFGSYWHEHMTDQLAQSAWQTFQDIEAIGGVDTYRESGQLNADISQSMADRVARNSPILGVTLHPTKDIKPPQVQS